ncbi:MAG: macro domain-containing protein [Lentisphaerota bacterium]
MDKSRSNYRFGTRVLTVIETGIELLTELDGELEVIVSSDDNYLTHGSGESAAIWKAAGLQLDEYVNHNRPALRLADVWPTIAGNLKLKAIYHAVKLDLDTNRNLSAESARELYGKILDLAGNTLIKKVALPLLGAGEGGMEADVSATAFAEALHTRSSITSATEHVYLVCSPDNYKSICRIMERKQIAPIGPFIFEAVKYLPEAHSARILELLNSMSNPENILSSVSLLDLLVDGLIIAASQNAKSEDLELEKRLQEGIIPDNLESATLECKLSYVKDLLDKINKPMASSMLNMCNAAVEAKNRLVCSVQNIEALSIILDASIAVARHIIFIAEGKSTGATGSLKTIISKNIAPMDAGNIAGLFGGSGVARGVAGGVAGGVGWALLGGPVGGIIGYLISSYITKNNDAYNSESHHDISNATSHNTLNKQSQTDIVSTDAHNLSTQQSNLHGSSFCSSAADNHFTQQSNISNVSKIVARIHLTQKTDPVRNIHALLVQEMNEEQKNELVDELGKQGYSGADNLRILEYCVREPNLIGLLVNHIGAPRLRKILKEYGYDKLAPTTNTEVLASKLIEHFGFPLLLEPRGLNSVASDIEVFKSRLVSVNDIEEMSGLVIQAGRELEYLLQIFIRFLCKVLFREAPEPYLQSNNQLEKTKKLDQCSLGTLIQILFFLSKTINTMTQANVLLPRVSERYLIPDNSNKLSELRNKFAHFKNDKKGNDISIMHHAKEFFEQAENLLSYLANNNYRVFPHVIRVSGVVVDEWGRRTVEAKTDNGKHESIFTDDILEPGSIYLMHPLTNPMRVDPILVPAGDLNPLQRHE